MLKKHLFVGVGGSGGATLRYLARELQRRFEVLGWDGPIPPGFQFLHVDVPYKIDVIQKNVPVDLDGDFRYVNLAAPPHPGYDYYDRKDVESPKTSAAYLQWRTNPRATNPDVKDGAGQRRTVGRVVSVASFDRMAGELREAIDVRLNGPEATMGMTQLATMLVDAGRMTDEEADLDPDPRVYVFSGIAGGSGSGAYLDVVEALKAMAAGGAGWLNGPGGVITALYTAEVFSEIEGKPGIEPNSLGAICEQINAHEYERELPESAQELLSTVGRIPRGRRSGAIAFVVGASNGEIRFSSQHDVYQSVAKGFAALIAEPKLHHDFQTYGIPNLSNNPNPVKPKYASLIAGSTDRSHPFGALGFASVTLGNKLFADYASERMSKLAIERLLEGHREQFAGSDRRPDDMLLDELADQLATGFARRCGLSELNGDDQVIDGLLSGTGADTLEQRVSGVFDRVRNAELGKSAGKRAERKPTQWFEVLRSSFDQGAIEFAVSEQARLEKNGPKWAVETQIAITKATQEYVARYGFPLTLRLLNRLHSSMADSSSELRAEAIQIMGSETGWVADLKSHLKALNEKLKIASNNAAIKYGFDSYRESLLNMGRRTAREKGANLIDLAARELIPAVIADISTYHTLLRDQVDGEYKTLVESWPTNDVPAHLKATENEVLLLPQTEYDEKLRSLIAGIGFKESDGVGASAASTELKEDDAVAAATTEVILGSWPKDGQKATIAELVCISSEWSPSAMAANLGTGGIRRPESRLRVIGEDGTSGFNPALILGQASRWVKSRDGELAKTVNESMADWLNANTDPALQAKRGKLFQNGLATAIPMAAPLAAINHTAYTEIYVEPVAKRKTVFGDIPMSKKHPGYAGVSSCMAAADPGRAAAEIDARFNQAAKGEAVEIITYLEAQASPFVFSSVTESIARVWNTADSAESRSTFWTNRRARPIEEFVPLSHLRQRAFVRGWLISSILGSLTIDVEAPWSSGPITVWTPDGDVAFPDNLLAGDPYKSITALPAVLESAAIAFLEFAAGDTRVLDAYRALVDTGTGPEGIENPFTALPTVLATWLKSGQLPKPRKSGTAHPGVREEFAGTAEMSAAERVATVKSAFTTLLQSIRKDYGDLEIDDETFRFGHGLWGIQGLVTDSVNDLLVRVEELEANHLDGKTVTSMGL